MAITWKSFCLNTNVDSSSSTSRKLLYTASNGVAEVNNATITNTGGASVNVSVCIASNATLSGTLQPIETVSVGAGATASVAKAIAHRVPSGGTIQAYASTTTYSCYITISGDERQQ
jgi:hypothetical protein